MQFNWMKCCAATGLAFAAGVSGAANAPFQTFFFSVCPTASGTLAARCAQTTGGLGNLSGDSESSLNPSQALGQNRSLVDSAQSRADAHSADPTAPAGARIEVGRFALLANVTGSWFDRDAGTTSVAERALDGDSKGAELGFDYRLSDRAVFGALLGVERSDYDFATEGVGTNFVPQASSGGGKVDDVYLTAFGSFVLGESGFLDLSGGIGKTDGRYRRYSVFQESTRTVAQVNTQVVGDSKGTTTWLDINAGHDSSWGAFGLGVFGGLNWTHSKLDGYSERDASGSGLAMAFGSSTRNSTLGRAGLRAAYTISGSTGVFVPQVRVEYQREFDTDPQSITSRFLLDPANHEFALVGDKQDKSGIEAAVSFSAVMSAGWSVFADYSMLLSRDDLDRSRLTLGLRKEF